MNELTEAIKTLGKYSKWYDVRDLSGRQFVRVRQALMQTLTGQKLPQSKCGVNALEAEMYKQANITQNCRACMQDEFETFCKKEVE